MATLSHYLVHNQRVWDDISFSSRTEVDVSEVWQHQIQHDVRISHRYRRLQKTDLTTWLHGRKLSSAAAKIDSDQLLLRLIWIPLQVQQKTLDVAQSIYKQAFTSSNHELSEGYCKTIPAGIGELHDNQRSNKTQSFFSLHPKIFMTWSTCRRTGGLIVICVAEEKKLPIFLDLLEQPFIHKIVSHASSPALIVAILLSSEVERTQDDIKRQVREVEVRTGHHNWKSRSERAALGDLTSLSAKMSGLSTRCGSCLRKQHILVEVLDFVSGQLLNPNSTEPATEGPQSAYSAALDMVDMLRKRASVQKTDNMFIQRRVDTQLEAVSTIKVSSFQSRGKADNISAASSPRGPERCIFGPADGF